MSAKVASSPSKMQAAPRTSFVTHAASRTLTTNQPSVTGVRPASSCSRRASSVIYLRAKHGAPGTGEETCLEQQRHDLCLADRLAVEAFDREPLRAALLHMVDERRKRDAQPTLFRIAQRHERAAAALDEQRGLSAEQDDVRSGDARGNANCAPPRPSTK